MGKTTLVETLVKEYYDTTLFLNGDDADIREALSKVSATKLIPLIGNNKI
ncbi:unnamed protein product, partial [marine sediment metagenome]